MIREHEGINVDIYKYIFGRFYFVQYCNNKTQIYQTHLN